MKEDILEQLVDEYLKHQGYFTCHNIKFKPSKTHADYIGRMDNVNSDIDVLAYHPKKMGHEKVLAVSCKSWQKGFNTSSKIQEIEHNKKISGRESWKGFRELVNPKWSEAFLDKIEEVTNSREFTYITAVTHLKGDKKIWEEYPRFQDSLKGNPIKIITMNQILDDLYPLLTHTPASSNIGRILQMMKSSGWQTK